MENSGGEIALDMWLHCISTLSLSKNILPEMGIAPAFEKVIKGSMGERD